MGFDITKRSAAETAQIELENGAGAPLLDDEGNRLKATICGPGSKQWQQADAERNRKRTSRIEKGRGKLTAAMEAGKEDETEFLVAITVSFDGWEYPAPKPDNWQEGDEEPKWPTKAEMFRAAYNDDTIGYIRDQLHKEGSSWEAFTKG